MTRNSPNSVGSRASATRCTSCSVRNRYATRSATAISDNPCSAANVCRSGRRAIEPSGFRISQITPAGRSPAKRARSTLASVCPTRRSTPPRCARSGWMWPGRRRSDGVVAGSIATRMVMARSLAEIPVLTPKRRSASIVTVNAVQHRFGVALHHLRQVEPVTIFRRQGEADPAAAVPRHEVDDFGRDQFRRADEIALILAVLVVDDHHHPAGLDVGDRAFDRRQRHRGPAALQAAQKCCTYFPTVSPSRCT